jgi:hypothetical protein
LFSFLGHCPTIYQVLLAGLADTWPARNTWTIDQLSLKYGDIAFRISQRSCKKISMKIKDYVSYMYLQHDEDPLYIFDDKVQLWQKYFFTLFLSLKRMNMLTSFDSLFISVWGNCTQLVEGLQCSSSVSRRPV